jgi:phosphate transport system substrate-binding protein
MRDRITTALAVVLCIATACGVAAAQTGANNTPAGNGTSTNGLDMQAARARKMTVAGKRVFYTKKYDLSGLPDYKARQQVSGTIRIWGSNYITDGMIGGLWEDAFRKYQPNVRVEWHMKTTEAAVPSLVFGVSDMGIGRKVTFSELQLYQRYTNHDPLEIEIATGSYNVPGWQPGFGVMVSKDNPLSHISMQQLDGIFGAARDGGWEGTSWHPEWHRGADKNIRTWGQLGLTGEWADKPIHVYGLNLRYHQATELSDWILQGSDKWNEDLHTYANYVSKDGKLMRNMTNDIAADKYGIGITAAPTNALGGGQGKLLAVGWTNAGPFIPYTMDNLQSRTYPLFDRIYSYTNASRERPLDPRVAEFLRFIVSRQGQELIEQDGKYLPLTAAVARAQTAKLDEAEK